MDVATTFSPHFMFGNSGKVEITIDIPLALNYTYLPAAMKTQLS